MSDQTPDTPPDPWDKVKRFRIYPRIDDPRLLRHYDAAAHQGQPDGSYMWAQDVDTARAQVEAQHAEEVAYTGRLHHEEWDACQAIIADLRAQLASLQATAPAREQTCEWRIVGRMAVVGCDNGHGAAADSGKFSFIVGIGGTEWCGVECRGH